ncbi:ATP-dependent RNA helicase DbpA [Candidatus Methanoplasma termitum]|uniref:DbpA2 protein n=1 Tax=Candidatus Methanoplasma termitum TaxID=1577791 RepID=A0A0A7LEY0_9ARCH|nr:DEAD/DEAH box helicase family protein [Candidatus Methanoplasma termitum]AIZ56887.1 ATP-dependent RNA helicase DbpA [Candidatus Methanoplasma termitum]
MGLKEIDFKESYDSNFNDIVIEFFEPALSAALEYDRQSGFFTSSSLSASAQGIANFIANKGKMRLLTSPILSKEDAEILDKAMNNPDALSEQLGVVLAKTLTSKEIENDGTQALGWMVANGFLEIRIVLLVDDEGRVRSSVDKEGIFHNKYGILKDGKNTVAFSGSINATGAALSVNIEDFDVYCDWRGDDNRIKNRIERFERYWNYGTDVRKKTVPFPLALKNQWIELVPKSVLDLHIFKKKATGKNRLRDYQQKAIDSWIKNNGIGIFSMATGTGKTYAATNAVKQILAKNNISKFILIVAVPFQHLIPQWDVTIRDTFDSFKDDLNIVQAFDSSKVWKPILRESVNLLKFGVIDNLIVLTTYDTLATRAIAEMIGSLKIRKIIIGDEVHNAGATKYREGLSEDYSYRLGLSATPTRYFDDEGSEAIVDYFGGSVFDFSLEKAIKTINPDTGKSYLTPYNYYPIFVSCNPEELGEYAELTKKIAKYAGADPKEEMSESAKKALEQLRINRSRIVKRAAAKVTAFGENLEEWNKKGFLNHCIVYCSDGSDDDNITYTERIITILNQDNIVCRRFTSSEQHAERKEILKLFSNGDLRALVAIKCLDEGVDVPSTENAIIMASTGNPREYIQRRGRVLRRYFNEKTKSEKTHANIFDFIVIPGEESGKYRDAESDIFNKEFRRFCEFSIYSMNHSESMTAIKKEAEKRGIVLGDCNESR